MVWGRVVRYQEQVLTHLRAVLTESHPPHYTAVSFAIGTFVTVLPTLGAGLIVLAVIGYRFDWANQLALYAPVALFNPLVKSVVYVASFALGTAILGPIEELEGVGDVTLDFGLEAGSEVLVRLLLGNAILAVLLAILGYAIVWYGVTVVRRERVQ